MAVEGAGALSASSTRATLNIPSPTRRSSSGGSLHSPQQPLSVDEVQVQPLVERLRYAQEHLKVSVNPRNGSLHLRGLLQAQAAVDATRVAQQDLTHQLLSMLRQQRQQRYAWLLARRPPRSTGGKRMRSEVASEAPKHGEIDQGIQNDVGLYLLY